MFAFGIPLQRFFGLFLGKSPGVPRKVPSAVLTTYNHPPFWWKVEEIFEFGLHSAAVLQFYVDVVAEIVDAGFGGIEDGEARARRQ